MKKLTTIFIAILFALSMTGLCFAQDKPVTPAPEKKVEEKKAPKEEKKKVKKAKKAKKEKKADEKKAEEKAPAPEKK